MPIPATNSREGGWGGVTRGQAPLLLRGGYRGISPCSYMAGFPAPWTGQTCLVPAWPAQVMNNSPYLRQPASVQVVMFKVLAALLPGVAAYVYFFGAGILVQLAIASAAADARRGGASWPCARKPVAIFVSDGSALVTAWLIALTLPPIVPWWITVVATLVCHRRRQASVRRAGPESLQSGDGGVLRHDHRLPGADFAVAAGGAGLRSATGSHPRRRAPPGCHHRRHAAGRACAPPCAAPRAGAATVASVIGGAQADLRLCRRPRLGMDRAGLPRRRPVADPAARDHLAHSRRLHRGPRPDGGLFHLLGPDKYASPAVPPGHRRRHARGFLHCHRSGLGRHDAARQADLRRQPSASSPSSSAAWAPIPTASPSACCCSTSACR